MLTVREEERVRLAVDEALDKWPRAIDAWDAVVWAIARDQYIGTPLTEDGKVRSFVFDGARSVGMPSIDVIVRFDGGTAMIEDAKFYEAPYGQAGHA